MSVGYYIDADANGNLGFFLASNNTELMYISDTGNFSILDQLTIGDETIISPSGYIGSGYNLAPTTLVTTATSYPLGVWGFDMYGTSGYPSTFGYLLSMASVENRNSMAQMYFSWTGYGTQNGNAGEDAYAWIRTNRDANNEFGDFQLVVLLQQNGDLDLGSYNSVSYGSGNINTSGDLSVSGEISGGSYNLVGGTGISFSGTTITNTGVTSITAGTNITISGSTGDVTIDASGGGTTYTAGNGITISGTTIEMSGSYSGNFDVSDNFISHGNSNSTPYFQAGVSGFGNGSWIETMWDNSTDYGAVFGEQNDVAYIGFINYGSSTYNGLNPNYGVFALQVGDNGSLYTLTGTGNQFSLSSSGSFAGTVRNTLDDGSGNMAASGQLTAQYIDSNINNDNPNGTTPTVVLSIWGGGQGNAVSSSTTYYGIGISDSTLDFLTNGGFAWWYNDTEVASMNGSGDLSLNGNLSLSGTATGGFALNFNSTTLRPSSLPFTYSVTVPAGTWAGYVQLGMFFTPSSGITYSYEASINMSGAALVSSFSSGTCALTDISGGTGSNYPLVNFPIIPISLESSGGTITFSINNTSQINGMTSILAGASDSAFRVNVFLVSTSTAS